jgi:hypothetical protein
MSEDARRDARNEANIRVERKWHDGRTKTEKDIDFEGEEEETSHDVRDREKPR